MFTADVYMSRFGFHDGPISMWKILRRLILTLKPGARIIVSDSILSGPNALSELDERKIR